MIIPKYPKVPDLTDNQIDEMTNIVFGEYLRIVYYGQIGEIENSVMPIKGLEKYI